MKDKFSKEIKSDSEAYYMSCPEVVAIHLANQLKNFNSAVELCCAVGIISIHLAKKMKKVYGIDVNPNRIRCAKENARLYHVDNVEFIVGDVLDESLLKKIKVDVVIIDPDWSEKGNLKSNHTLNIENTQPSWKKMFELTSKYLTTNIVSRIPKEWDFDTLKEFGVCKIENIIWNGEIKFKIVYFGEDIKENLEEDIVFKIK